MSKNSKKSKSEKKPWKAHGTIEGNPIGLTAALVKGVIPDLDAHLASLFVLFHQYQKHHWLVEGPQFNDLHLFLGKSYEAVHLQADKVAERITALGGIPTSNPVAQADIAYIEHEPEGVFRIREMLKRDLLHEGAICVELRQTIASCRKQGDYGSETLLMGILLETEDRAHHLEHFLGEDSLEPGRSA